MIAFFAPFIISRQKSAPLLGSKPEFQLGIDQVKVGDWIGYYNTDKNRCRGGGQVIEIRPKSVILDQVRGFKIGSMKTKGSPVGDGKMELKIGGVRSGKFNGWKIITPDKIAHVKSKGARQ